MATKTKLAAVKVGELSLVSLSHTALLCQGGDVTLDAMRKFVGQRVEVETVRAHDTEWVKLADVSQNRDTGDVSFWVMPEGSANGRHLVVRTKRS